MNKQFFKALLCGVVILSAGIFSSCNDNDLDELKSRITVVEVAIDDIKTQLSKALMTGASIVNVEQNNGTYKLTLSDGQIITITPGTSGGGSTITVEKNENNVIITIDGTEYVLPMGSAVNSLIYSPEYADGIVIIGNEGATVSFLATPAVDANALKNATFDIAEAHELKTRGGNGLFRVKGEVKLEGDFIKVPIKGLGVEAGKSYAVAVLMNVSGTVISSNYFTVKTTNDFFFESEVLVTPTFKDVTGTDLTGGFWTATVPETSEISFLGEFNFKSLVSLPGIDDADLSFELGKKAEQNENVQGRYDILKKFLSENGTWKVTERPGTNCNKKGDTDTNPDGLLIYVKADDVIKAKIYWKVIDPLASVDFTTGLKGLYSQHMEREAVFPKGVNRYDIAKEITAGNFNPKHGDTDKFIAAFQAYSITAGSETVIMNNGEKLEVTEYGQKLAKFSRGLNWFNIQTSVIASQGTEGGNGEIVGGWDGISGTDMANLGLKITGDGFFETTAAYGGIGLRVGMGVEFEYAYGLKAISEGCLAYIFFNRRVSPDGVTNLSPR